MGSGKMGTATKGVRGERAVEEASARAALGMTLLLMVGMLAAIAPAATAAGSCVETAYANGNLYCIFVTKVIGDASPGLLATAEPIYIAAYFPLPQGCDTSNPSTCGPEGLPSGYQPLRNPCFHGDGLNAFPYHDHVMEGAPGFGKDDTADAMKGPWVLIIVAHDPALSNRAGFSPFRSAADIRTGEVAGDFQAINAGGSNAYEINTGVVIIFGVQPLG